MDFDAGELVRIECETKISNVFDDPDTMQVSITQGSKTGTSVLSPADMTNDSTGHWSYGWDTTGLDAGEYWAKLHGTKTAPGNWEYKSITLV